MSNRRTASELLFLLEAIGAGKNTVIKIEIDGKLHDFKKAEIREIGVQHDPERTLVLIPDD